MATAGHPVAQLLFSTECGTQEVGSTTVPGEGGWGGVPHHRSSKTAPIVCEGEKRMEGHSECELRLPVAHPYFRVFRDLETAKLHC